ncbi:hypothetical protein E1162_00575 [Rhodobacteraceae bacterium RKSG542]|uniref:hypothetical protein n=1 Tax=Pseudovibrio flavus TaxID=2529854 RepID=UPI0012BC5E13|nr:hypothetical protein [Pseudovibrio flavus]MTI15728.1 hypothetical protein [Pseudovibrio flavus]
MATVKVYGSKPDNGPSLMKSQAAAESVNEDHEGWDVELDYKADTTTAVFTSETADPEDLEKALEPFFPGYYIVAA